MIFPRRQSCSLLQEEERMNSEHVIKRSNPVLDWVKQHIGALIGFAVLFCAMSVLSPRFLTVSNMLNVSKAVSSNLILASVLTMIIIMGGIDISVGSITGVTGMLAAQLIGEGSTPIWLTIVLCLCLGMATGLFNGFFVAKMKLPPFIVTLATQNICRGMTQVICNGTPIRVNNENFNKLGTTTFFGGVSIVIIYAIIVVIISSIILGRTRIGSYIYAIGGNEVAAKYSGINVVRVKMFPFFLAGLYAAICGVMWTARIGSGSPSLGTNFELDAIAASALGGVSMAGGVGSISGTIIGVFILGVINNGMNLINLNSFWQLVVKGIVVLVAVVIDVLRKNRGKDK